MRILFVENHPTFAEVACRQFLAGRDVTVAASLAAARVALACATFDAVLVDFDLDDGKGDALVAELAQARFGGPIIAVSSHAEGNAALRSAGATAVCAKADFARLSALLEPRG